MTSLKVPILNTHLFLDVMPLPTSYLCYIFSPSLYLKEKQRKLSLKAKDTIILFNRTQPREAQMSSLISELTRQGKLSQLPLIVTINGALRYPGVYP